VDPELFNTFASVERTHWWFTARRDILLSITERHVAPGSAILDVGCGTGYFIEGLGGRYEAWGIDPSPISVRMCRERGLERVVQGTAYDLSSVGDRRFDAVYFLDVIEHLDDDARALVEAKRVLAPGGLVVITVPAFNFLWSDHDVVNEHRRRYDRPGLVALLDRVGLRVERLSYFNFYLFGLAGIDRLAGRLLRRRVSAELQVPSPLVNRLMGDTFRSERHRLADSSRKPFPFGLSLLAVARKSEA
jgi:SAM-dependent methyltransferase